MAANSALIEELIHQYAQNPRRVFARLANEYRKAGKLDDAILICRSNVPLQPTYISGYIVLGQALYDYGQLDESRETFEAALNLDPENLIALRHLGDIARAGGDFDGARSWYHRLLEVDPQNDEISHILAQLDAAVQPSAPGSRAEDVSWSDINPEHARTTRPPTPPRPMTPVVPPVGLDFGDDAQDALQSIFDDPQQSATPTASEPRSEAAHHEYPATATPPSAPPDDPQTRFAPDPYAVPGVVSAPGAGWMESAAPAAPNEPEPTVRSEVQAEASSAPEHELGETGAPPAQPGSDVVFQRAQWTEHEEEEPALGAEADVEPPAPPRPAVESWSSLEISAAPVDDTEIAANTPSTGAWDIEQPYDPTVGRMLDLPHAVPHEATPAAFVTETMAELYLQQGFHEAALHTYRQLSAQRPDDQALKDRIASLEGGGRSSISVAASIPEDVITAARERVVRSGRTIRSFFASFFDRQLPGSELSPSGSVDADALPMPSAAAAPSYAYAPDEDPIARALDGFGSYSPAPSAPIYTSEPIEPAGVAAEGPVAPVAPAAPVPVEPMRFDAWERPAEPTVSTPEEAADVDIADPIAAPAPAKPREPAHLRPRPSGVPFSELFATPVPAADEQAASALAGAFSEEYTTSSAEFTGQPTRATNAPLTLDDVFGDGRARTEAKKPTATSVSFDEFFAKRDNAPSNGDGRTDAATTPEEPGHAAPADLALFHEWLDGLKK